LGIQIELATAAALARDIGRPEPWAPVLQVDRRQVGALRMCSAQHAGGADYPLEPVAISLRLVPDSRDVRGFVRKRTHRTRQSIGPFVAPNACMRLRQRCQLRADLGRHKNRSRLRLRCIAGESPPGAKRPGCAVPIGARIAVDLRPSVSETGDDSPEAPILMACGSHLVDFGEARALNPDRCERRRTRAADNRRSACGGRGNCHRDGERAGRKQKNRPGDGCKD